MDGNIEEKWLRHLLKTGKAVKLIECRHGYEVADPCNISDNGLCGEDALPCSGVVTIYFK